MPGKVHVIDHPLVQHKLTLMRSKETSTSTFRNLLREISMLLAYEVCRDLPTTKIKIETPIAPMQAPVLDGKKIVLISVLRAGNGILDGMLEILPSARVGHIGLYRDPKTLVAVEYYYKVPDNMGDRDVIVVDPMLATGNSAVAAIDRLKDDPATAAIPVLHAGEGACPGGCGADFCLSTGSASGQLARVAEALLELARARARSSGLVAATSSVAGSRAAPPAA